MTTVTIESAVKDAFEAARAASAAIYDQYNMADACGFNWVMVTPGTSKVARYLKEQGLGRKHHGEPGIAVWNPSRTGSQSITVGEAGASAFARVLREQLGVEALSQSRMD